MGVPFRILIARSSVAALICVSACTTAATQQMSALRRDPQVSTTEPPRLGPPSDIISAEELRGTSAPSLTVAVRWLRQEFMRPTTVPVGNGTTTAVGPSVYLNGVYAGGIEALETIALAAVEEVRFIRPTQARDWWGAYCPCAGGVIHVRTRTLR